MNEARSLALHAVFFPLGHDSCPWILVLEPIQIKSQNIVKEKSILPPF